MLRVGPEGSGGGGGGTITDIVGGTGIGVTDGTGPTTTITNTGVTSILAGPGVEVSNPTGTVTVSTGPGMSNLLYVSQNGSDATGTGSFTLPYATYAKAATTAVADGASAVNPYSVMFAPGTYTENILLVPNVDVSGIDSDEENAVFLNGPMGLLLADWAGATAQTTSVSNVRLGLVTDINFLAAGSTGASFVSFYRCYIGNNFTSEGTSAQDVYLIACVVHSSATVASDINLVTVSTAFYGGSNSLTITAPTFGAGWFAYSTSLRCPVTISGTVNGVLASATLTGTSINGLLTLNGPSSVYSATIDGIPGSGLSLTGGATILQYTILGSVPGQITMELFGAVGNGVVSDQPAYAAALSALGASVAAGAGPQTLLLGSNRTYLVTGGTLPAGCTILGQGDSSCLATTSNAPVINIGGLNCTCERFQILGNNVAGPLQVGIKNGDDATASSGFVDLRVHNVFFNSLSTGLYLSQFGTNVSSVFRGPLVTGIRAINCQGQGAIYLGIEAEYTTVANFVLYTGFAGITVACGNSNLGPGIITDAGIGIWIRGDGGVTFTNDSHGIAHGITVNHCITDNILVDEITKGYTFSACSLVGGGNITLNNSLGVKFSDCTLDFTTLLFNGSKGTVFDGNQFQLLAANVITNSNASTTRWCPSNFGWDGTVPDIVAAADDGTNWTYNLQGILELVRNPSQSPLGTDRSGFVTQLIANPLALGGTMQWLRSDLGVTTVAGKVTVWADQSGAGDANRNQIQATLANQPPYNASNAAYNGRPTIGNFTGTMGLVSAGAWTVPPPNVGTVAMVGNLVSGAVVFMLDGGPDANRYAIKFANHNLVQMLIATGSYLPAPDAVNIPFAVIIDLNGTEATIYLSALPLTSEGLLGAGTEATGASSAVRVTTGNAYDFSAPVGGAIAEQWISSNRIGVEGTLQLFAYFSTLYG